MTNEEKVIRFRKIVNEMADLYEKKNKNYGNSFGELFEKLGPISGLVPLHNKLDRATNLVNGGVNNFESLEDTFKDLACYAVMNLIEMEAEKYKELKITVPKDALNYTTESIGSYKIFADPCGDCKIKRKLNEGITFVGDLPCEWCNKNPYKMNCNNTTILTKNGNDSYTTNSLNERKGERKTNEK